MRARLLAPALAATFLLVVVGGLVGLFVLVPPRPLLATADAVTLPAEDAVSAAAAPLEPVQEADAQAVGASPIKRVVSVIPVNGSGTLKEAEVAPVDAAAVATSVIPEVPSEPASQAAPEPGVEHDTAEISVPAPIDAGTYIPIPRPIEERPGRNTQAGDAELITNGVRQAACASVDSLTDGDGDFQRNRKAINDGIVCVREERFADSGADWIVHVATRTDGHPGPLWVVPHDDEDVAFDNGIDAVTRYGGVLVSVETGGARKNGSIDPNSVFAEDADACDGAAPHYARTVLAHRRTGYPVIGLHSNDPGSVATGGQGVISIDAPLKNAVPYKANPFIPSESNQDTLAFVASTKPAGKDPVVDKMVEALLQKGINVIRELVTPKTNDCSLSNYLALRGLQPYYNLEVVHGDRVTQALMVNLIMKAS